MNELKLDRVVSEVSLQGLIEQFALDLEGRAALEAGAARLEFPVHHRFYRGIIRVRLAWERAPGGLTLRAETDTADAEVSAAGRALLILGAVSCLPWLLWWFFPSLLPLVPLSALFVFLAWLGVARKPAFFEPGFFLQAMASRLRDATEG